MSLEFASRFINFSFRVNSGTESIVATDRVPIDWEIITEGLLIVLVVSLKYAYFYIVQVYEVLDNAIDEAQAGFADTVDIIVHTDGSVTISDNGRGVSLNSFIGVRLYIN